MHTLPWSLSSLNAKMLHNNQQKAVGNQYNSFYRLPIAFCIYLYHAPETLLNKCFKNTKSGISCPIIDIFPFPGMSNTLTFSKHNHLPHTLLSLLTLCYCRLIMQKISDGIQSGTAFKPAPGICVILSSCQNTESFWAPCLLLLVPNTLLENN